MLRFHIVFVMNAGARELDVAGLAGDGNVAL